MERSGTKQGPPPPPVLGGASWPLSLFLLVVLLLLLLLLMATALGGQLKDNKPKADGCTSSGEMGDRWRAAAVVLGTL